MHIDDRHSTIEPLWEGALAQPSETYATRGAAGPHVTLGKPAWWSDTQMLGDAWHAPAGGQRYGVARFAFSLRVDSGQTVQRVTFSVALHAQPAGARPIAFDLSPMLTTATQTGTRKVGVGPGFKFFGVDVTVGQAEFSITTQQAVPVIAAEGVGESAVRWVFAAHPAHPLVGAQLTYIVVELPQGVAAASAAMHLTADVQTRLGRALFLPPQAEGVRWSYVLQ